MIDKVIVELHHRPHILNNVTITQKTELFLYRFSQTETGVVAIHTISTLFYILKKYIPSDNIREIFYSLFTIIEIGSADKESVLHALKNKTFPDF
ncbi:MAG: hypothetical protein ACTTH7_06985 [Treponema sp.]